VEAVKKTPGVKAVVPSVQSLSMLHSKGRKLTMCVMGIDPAIDGAVRDYDLREGRFFEKKYEVLLEVGFAQGLGLKVGDEVKMMTTRKGMTTFTVAGLLAPSGAAGFKQGGIAFIPLKTAQATFGRPGNVNLVSVVLNDGVDEKKMEAALAANLPNGLTARSPSERSRLSTEVINSVQKGLDVSYATIMALAFTTILNTFLMNIGERRRQLAVLRAIGATRKQIIRMLLAEGAMMGVFGTLLGMAAGVGGAFIIAQAMAKTYATPMPALRITPMPFIVAGCLGPVISVLAVIFPAWFAGKISPLEGMRFVVSDRRGRISAAYVVSAFFAFLITGSLLGACILGYLPVQIMTPLGAVPIMTIAGVLFTLAFLLLLPLILGPLARLLSTLLYPVLRTEGRIAHRQILRRRVRTTLTIGILYIAVSTAVALGTNILNTVDDIHASIKKTFGGDYLVRAMNQDMSTGMSAKMPEEFVNVLRGIEGVANVDSVRLISGVVLSSHLEDGKQSVAICIRDFTDQGELPMPIKDGNPKTLRKQLAEGEVILGAPLARRLGVKVGDAVALEGNNNSEFRVAATATTYNLGGMMIYMEGKAAQKRLNAEGVDMFIVNVKPGMWAAVGDRVKACCEAEGLLFQSFADLQRRVEEMTRGVVGGLWGLLILGLIVGAFAMANTLTMNVLEQTRELALLRVVAMTRWQVRKTILSQAVIVGSIGLLTGTLGGMIGAYVMNLSSVPLLGQAPEFVLHPSLLLLCVGIGFVVILAAAWLPAERAARLKLLIALQYE